MLDLLLDRAYVAHDLVMASAEALPSALELTRVRLSEEFCDLMYEVLLSIAASDGKAALTSRKSEIEEFAELFAEVLWQINSQHEQMQYHLHQLLCAKCRANLHATKLLRKSKFRFN